MVYLKTNSNTIKCFTSQGVSVSYYIVPIKKHYELREKVGKKVDIVAVFRDRDDAFTFFDELYELLIKKNASR